jgi:hypothetical protein
LHHGDPAQVATILAALDVFRTTAQTLPHKPEDDHISHRRNQVGPLLSPDQLNAAWQCGTTPTLDDIIELAIEEYGESAFF